MVGETDLREEGDASLLVSKMSEPVNPRGDGVSILFRGREDGEEVDLLLMVELPVLPKRQRREESASAQAELEGKGA